MHWAFAPIFLIASFQNPDVLILPAMLASINIAQGAASLAVSFKAKDKCENSCSRFWYFSTSCRCN